MKTEIRLVEKGKGNVPIGLLSPPRAEYKRVSVILKGDRDIIKEVEKLIEAADKWDIL